MYLILICSFCAALPEIKLDKNFESNKFVELQKVNQRGDFIKLSPTTCNYPDANLAYIKSSCKISGFINIVCFAPDIVVEFYNFSFYEIVYDNFAKPSQFSVFGFITNETFCLNYVFFNIKAGESLVIKDKLIITSDNEIKSLNILNIDVFFYTLFCSKDLNVERIKGFYNYLDKLDISQYKDGILMGGCVYNVLSQYESGKLLLLRAKFTEKFNLLFGNEHTFFEEFLKYSELLEHGDLPHREKIIALNKKIMAANIASLGGGFSNIKKVVISWVQYLFINPAKYIGNRLIRIMKFFFNFFMCKSKK